MTENEKLHTEANQEQQIGTMFISRWNGNGTRLCRVDKYSNGKPLSLTYNRKKGQWMKHAYHIEIGTILDAEQAKEYIATGTQPSSIDNEKLHAKANSSSIEKRHGVALSPFQPVKSKEMDLEKHRAHIKSLSAEQTISATLNGYQFLEHATAVGDLYLAACQKHFDNRGQGDRVISGFNGFEDFVERGLGGHIRTIQRRLKKFYDPEAVKEDNEKRRLAAKEQKQVVQKARAAAAEPPTSTERDIPEKPAEGEPPESPTTTKPSTKKSAARSEQVFENDGEYVALTINWVIKLLEPVEKTDPKRYVKLVKLITSRLTEELVEGLDGE